MVILHNLIHAATAAITMVEILPPSYSTDTAFFAVEHFFVRPFIIIKWAYLAVVFGEIFQAFGACFAFNLLGLAPEALDVGNFVAV